MAWEMMYTMLFALWGALIIGFYIKDYAILALVSLLFLFWGLKVVTEGLAGEIDMYTDAFGGIHLAIGLYLFLRSSYETYKNW